MKEGVTLTAVSPLATWDRFGGETLNLGSFSASGSPVSHFLQKHSLSGRPTTEARMIRDISIQSGNQRTIDDDGMVDINQKP